MNLIVSHPQGAGGSWLAGVINHCATGEPLEKHNSNNFHHTWQNKVVQCSHDTFSADNIISIDSKNARYNFWRYYIIKRILTEKKYKRVRNFRVPQIEYTNLNSRDQFFWLINQARWIESYTFLGNYTINWIDVFKNREKVWKTIQSYLDTNKVKNMCSYIEFENYCNLYHKTIAKVNTQLNWKSPTTQFYCAAILQNHNIDATIDVYEEFLSAKWFDFVDLHQTKLNNILKNSTVKQNFEIEFKHF